MQCGDAGPNGLERLLGERKIATVSSKFAVEHEIERTFQIGLPASTSAEPGNSPARLGGALTRTVELALQPVDDHFGIDVIACALRLWAQAQATLR